MEGPVRRHGQLLFFIFKASATDQQDHSNTVTRDLFAYVVYVPERQLEYLSLELINLEGVEKFVELIEKLFRLGP